MPAKRSSALAQLYGRMLGVPEDGLGGSLNLSLAQEKQIAKWSESAWNFLTAQVETDEGRRALIWTKDEKDPTAPLKPFPAHLRYLRELLDVLHYETRVVVDKARQMYVTTIILLYCHWYCIFNPATRVVLSKNKENEAKELIKDKIRFPHSTMPLWAQAALPCSKRPQKAVNYARNEFGGGDSTIIGAPMNVADREARGGTATIVLIDEAARQTAFGSIWQGAAPMTYKIIAPSTPEIGNQGAVDFKAILDDVVADNESGIVDPELEPEPI